MNFEALLSKDRLKRVHEGMHLNAKQGLRPRARGRFAKKDKKYIRRPKNVSYNENERSEYLTGFRKRKQERRQYGLQAQKRKEKQERSELKKEKKANLQKLIEESGLQFNDDEEEETQVKDMPDFSLPSKTFEYEGTETKVQVEAIESD